MQPGTIIDDKYEILSPLGMGGFGAVFRARQLGLDREVAIKVLHADDLESEAARVRFEREAQALCSLHHRNVVLFYGYGRWNDQPYIVMELVDGRSLESELLKVGKLSVERTLRIVEQVASALDCAHSNGIIHRDLKPTNIMLCASSDGELVKLIDFGLVKSVPLAGVEAQKLTHAGTAIGTVQYMSPEQCQALDVDHRTDLYSLGCVFQRCLTGSAPFLGDQSGIVVKQHVLDRPPTLNESCPTEQFAHGLQYILDRALAKNPDDRYQTANEFLSDLRSLSQKTNPALLKSSRRHKAISGAPSVQLSGIIFGAAALALLVAATGFILFNKASVKQPNESSVELYARARQLNDGRPESAVQRIPARELLKKALEANESDHLLDSAVQREVWNHIAGVEGDLHRWREEREALQHALVLSMRANLIDSMTESMAWAYESTCENLHDPQPGITTVGPIAERFRLAGKPSPELELDLAQLYLEVGKRDEAGKLLMYWKGKLPQGGGFARQFDSLWKDYSKK